MEEEVIHKRPHIADGPTVNNHSHHVGGGRSTSIDPIFDGLLEDDLIPLPPAGVDVMSNSISRLSLEPPYSGGADGDMDWYDALLLPSHTLPSPSIEPPSKRAHYEGGGRGGRSKGAVNDPATHVGVQLIESLMQLNQGFLSVEDMGALALTCKATLGLRQANTNAAKGLPSALYPRLPDFPRLKHLILSMDANIFLPPRDRHVALCPQLAHLTLILNTYEGYTSEGLPCNVLEYVFSWLGTVRRLESLEIHIRAPYCPPKEDLSVFDSVLGLLTNPTLSTLSNLTIRGMSLSNATKIMTSIITRRSLPALRSLTLGPYEDSSSTPTPAAPPVSPDFFRALTMNTTGQLKSLQLYGPMQNDDDMPSPLFPFLDERWDWPTLDVMRVTCKAAVDLLPYFIIDRRWPVRCLGLTMLAQLPRGFQPPEIWPMTTIYQELQCVLLDSSTPPISKSQAITSIFNINYSASSTATAEARKILLEAQNAFFIAAFHANAQDLIITTVIDTMAAHLTRLPISFFTPAFRGLQPGLNVGSLTTLAYRVVMDRERFTFPTRKQAMKVLIYSIQSVSAHHPALLALWCMNVINLELVEDLLPLLLKSNGPERSQELSLLASALATSHPHAVDAWLAKGAGPFLAFQWIVHAPMEVLKHPSLYPLAADNFLSHKEEVFSVFVSAVRKRGGQAEQIKKQMTALIEAMFMRSSMTARTTTLWTIMLSDMVADALGPSLFIDVVLSKAYQAGISPPNHPLPNSPTTAIERFLSDFFDLLLQRRQDDEEEDFMSFYYYAVKVLFGGWGEYYDHIKATVARSFKSHGGSGLIKTMREALVAYSLAGIAAEDGVVVCPVYQGMQGSFVVQAVGRRMIKTLGDILEHAARPKRRGRGGAFTKALGSSAKRPPWKGQERLIILCRGLKHMIRSTPALELIEALAWGSSPLTTSRFARPSKDKERVIAVLTKASSSKGKKGTVVRRDGTGGGGGGKNSHDHHHDGQVIMEVLSWIEQEAQKKVIQLKEMEEMVMMKGEDKASYRVPTSTSHVMAR